MIISRLKIERFRNLCDIDIIPNPSFNIIYGDNGSGKTSLLEAIYFLSHARSFRTPQSKKLIQHQKQDFQIFSTLVDDHQRGIRVGIHCSHNHLKIRKNSEDVKSRSELAAIQPQRIINPDVHKILEDAPRFRRRLIEWGVFHVEQSYGVLLKDFRQLLKQRNAVLKNKRSERELNSFDGQFIRISEALTSMRISYVDELKYYAEKILWQFGFVQSLDISFYQGWPRDQKLLDVLQKHHNQDFKTGFTGHGPHKFDIHIKVDGVFAKDVVSRGQQKVLSTGLILAQVNMLASKSNKQTIILFDDIAAELDVENRNKLVEILADLDTQVFLTSVSNDSLDFAQRDLDRSMFHVKHGRVNAT